MQLSFRWYGPNDSVTLSQIRQIPGMQGIVTALHDVPAGQVWPQEDVLRLRGQVEDAGLTLSVIESVPVHEDIKMGLPSRDAYIENYQSSLVNIAAAGIDTVCYNFMPLFDWLRTSLAYALPDGSTTLAYDDAQVSEAALLSGQLNLPAWNLTSDHGELIRILDFYKRVSPEQLWEHLEYFVQAVLPVAKANGIKLVIHPDDPPWSVVGIPRIIVDEPSVERFLKLYDAPCHGLCFCSGSFGASEANDLPAMIRRFGSMGRIHFVHLRNVKRTGPHSFYESGHLSAEGSLDMHALMSALSDIGYEGPVRPDHGRMVWGESGKPGYGLYDRALGATYLSGLWEGIGKTHRTHR